MVAGAEFDTWKAMSFTPPPPLLTPRFLLRPFRAGDGAHLAEAVRSSYEHLSATLSWPVREPRVEDEEAKVQWLAARYAAGEDFTFALLTPDESLFLGAAGYHLRGAPLSDRSAEISLWIRASHARSGLGTEVTRALLRWGFEAWGFERLAWVCRPDNVGSRRAAEKAGLRFEGTLRGLVRRKDGTREDMCFYARLSTDRD